jgi:phytoene dehydrogenase-like protein
VLDEYFESEELKAVLCVGGVIGTNAGPRTPGTAYVKYHHILGKIAGHQGAWGYVRGGMGAVSQAIASSAREAGVEILTDAEVAEIDISDGTARGVTSSTDAPSRPAWSSRAPTRTGPTSGWSGKNTCRTTSLQASGGCASRARW